MQLIAGQNIFFLDVGRVNINIDAPIPIERLLGVVLTFMPSIFARRRMPSSEHLLHCVNSLMSLFPFVDSFLFFGLAVGFIHAILVTTLPTLAEVLLLNLETANIRLAQE